MSEHVASLVADLSAALENREFDRAEGLITDLERAYDERRADERATVDETKRRYAESTADGIAEKEAFAGLLGESGTTQFTRVAALTLAASVTDEHVDAARASLAELADAEPSFAATLDTVDEMDASSDTDGGGTDGPLGPPGLGGDSNAETPTETSSREPADDEEPVDGPFEPPGPSGESDSGTATATPSSGQTDGSTGEDDPLGPPGLPGDSDLETATATQSPSPDAGDATATTGSDPATSDDDSPESDAETTAADGPGFGLSSTLASVGGVGYLFYRRLTGDGEDDE